MAFREDGEALHARIEQLERELAEAKGELATLAGVVEERDRLKARLEALEPKKKPPQPKRERERASPASPRKAPTLQAMFLAAMIAILFFGLLTYMLAECSSPGGVAESKPADTRVPSLGVIDLAATPDPAPIAFTVTGTQDAPSGCSGYLPSDPQLVLRSASPMLLRATTRCSVDLVAVLSGMPTGMLCDDDSGDGANPLVQATLPAGETRLTIGTYSEGATAGCEILLHAVALPSGADAHGLAASAPPRAEVVGLGAGEVSSPDSEYAGTVTDAVIDGSTLQPGCVGHFASAPDFVLDVTEPTIVRLDASSESDLVLLLEDADGVFTCDDDDGMGNAPRIAKRVPPGHYPVWVGTFAEEPVPPTFRASARLTTIASEAAHTVTPVVLADGVETRVSGTTGDELSAPSMWSTCALPGYVPFMPSQTFRLAARREVTITSGRGDLLLAVLARDRDAELAAQTCTAEPTWRGTLDAGSYDLFVGVPSGDFAPGPYELTISVSSPSVLPYAPSRQD